jgi:hypothetical protein
LIRHTATPEAATARISQKARRRKLGRNRAINQQRSKRINAENEAILPGTILSVSSEIGAITLR